MNSLQMTLEAFYALEVTLGAFALILILSRLKLPLPLAIIVSSIVLGAFMGLSPAGIALAAATGASKPTCIGMILALTLLLMISEAMRCSGQLDEIVHLAGVFFRRPAVTMAALPALIGLLPMPGGALFSAPMVESAARQRQLSPQLMSAINYWWRHIWEYWWPLYPAVILAMTLVNQPTSLFALHQLPMTILMALTGISLLRKAHIPGQPLPPPPPGTKRQLLRATSTIWVILIIWASSAGLMRLILGPISPAAGPQTYAQQAAEKAREFVPLLLGLLGSLVWIVRRKRIAPGRLARFACSKSMYPLLGLVVAIMVFQGVIQDSHAAGRIAQELTASRFPVIVVVVIVPMVAGLVTGLGFGFVGVSFPIVMGLVQSLPGHPAIWPYVMLAFASGHFGMMISPIHVCYLVSNRYFNIPFGPVYRLLAPPMAMLACFIAAYFVLLRYVVY